MYTKFEDSCFTVLYLWSAKNINGSRYLTTILSGVICCAFVKVATTNLTTKCEVFILRHKIHGSNSVKSIYLTDFWTSFTCKLNTNFVSEIVASFLTIVFPKVVQLHVCCVARSSVITVLQFPDRSVSEKTLKIGFDCVIAKEFVVFIFGIQCTE